MMQTHLHPVLNEPVGNLGQVGGFSHTIDTHKDDGVGLALGFGGVDLAQDVNGALGGENAGEGGLHCLPHRTADSGEAVQLLSHQIACHRLTHPAPSHLSAILQKMTNPML